MTISILCGGSGTRLWPLSRELMPKQFIPLISKTSQDSVESMESMESKNSRDSKNNQDSMESTNSKTSQSSLFQQTILRNLSLGDEFCIVTNDKHYFLAQDEIEKINTKNKRFSYILESESKNTAAALLFVALNAKKDDIILALPSDHIIKNIESYKNAILKAQDLAKNGNIVVFGIKPDSPHTGYGYIKDSKNGVIFAEKPNLETAKKYLESRDYFWNSGMFCFKASTLIGEFQAYKNEMLKQCQNALKNGKDNQDFVRLKPKDTQDLEEISIDYAIMEKSKKLKLLKADFYWSDLGDFAALKKEYESDSDNNATNTNLIALDSTNNLVLGEKTAAIIGVNDLIVVDTSDSLLISSAKENQKIKEVVKILKAQNSELCKIHRTAYRPWGSYSVLLESANYKIKQIIVKPKKRLSLQKHFHRNEHWVVVSGSAVVSIDGNERFLKANQSTYIPMGSVHRLENPGKINLVIIEVQVGEYLGEDDIVRLEDDYHRS